MKLPMKKGLSVEGSTTVPSPNETPIVSKKDSEPLEDQKQTKASDTKFGENNDFFHKIRAFEDTKFKDRKLDEDKVKGASKNEIRSVLESDVDKTGDEVGAVVKFLKQAAAQGIGKALPNPLEPRSTNTANTPAAQLMATLNSAIEGLPRSGNLREEMEALRKEVTWNDEVEEVVGHDKVKVAIESAFLMSNTLNDPLPSSVMCQHILLAGLGGIGKTVLMTNAAVQASKLIKKPISVFIVRASDLLSKYLGESEKIIKTLLDVVETHAPSLLVLDEVDGLMKARSSEESDATRRFMTTFLSELRGTRKLSNVAIIAATNRPGDLDDNFLSRFKLKFVMRLPSAKEREQIFKKFLTLCETTVEVEWPTMDWKKLGNQTAGYSGNDIATVVGIAASDSYRVKFKDYRYRVEDVEQIRGHLELEGAPIRAVMLPITMDAILRAMKRVPPSISSMSTKELAKWERKHIVFSTTIKEDTKEGLTFLGVCGIALRDMITPCMPF